MMFYHRRKNCRYIEGDYRLNLFVTYYCYNITIVSLLIVRNLMFTYQQLILKKRIISLWLIVGLLLMMPFAQAAHWAEHDVPVEEIHCQTCSASMFDGLGLPSFSLSLNLDFKTHSPQSPIIIKKQNFVCHSYQSRAPPLF